MANADQLAKLFMQQAQQSKNTGMIASALYEQASNNMARNQYESAAERLNHAIEDFQTIDDRIGLAKSYRQLGMVHRYQANYPLALEYMYLALQIYQQVQDLNAISGIHNGLGVILEKMGQYEEASQAHHKALQLNRQLDDQSGVASALYNLGDIRRVMGDYELALTYFTDALKMDLTAGDAKNIAYSYHKIGFVNLQMGNVAVARQNIQKARDMFVQIEAPRDIDWANASMAELLMTEGKLEEAKQLIEGVISRAIANNYKSLLVDAYHLAGQIAFRMDQTSLALEHIDKGIELAQVLNEQFDQARLEKLRVKVHLKNDALAEAFAALQRQKQLDDKLMNSRRLDAIANVQAQVEFVRREQQIDLLEKEKALQQASLQQQELWRNIIISGIIAAFVLIFLLYGRYVQRRLNANLSEQVQLRTLELEAKNKQLQQAYREMEAISLTDKLTGIKNRRFLEQYINTDLQKSYRTYTDFHAGKIEQPLQSDIIVFMIDMDNFKDINDKYGHASGDLVLKQLTQRMANVFRESDYLVRWGGEEFLGIVRFIDRKDAVILAQRMLEAVRQMPFLLADNSAIDQTCSIGFVCYPPCPNSSQETDWLTLVAMADACLYAAKYSGKNCWVGIEEVLDSTICNQTVSPQALNQWLDFEQIRIRHSKDSIDDIKWLNE
ncbi:diguanylate cyclase [Aliiglaciecola litoralis]|uniref:diguanylate cyclase n=2 Tax=Aliiglaciecola litoralis TaxID=582857 RepID=A0ABP3WMK4_9ALTE